MCKILQQGDWSGLVEHSLVTMLSAKNSGLKVLDVKTVTYKKQKRKLVLFENRSVYKIKKSKFKDNVKPGQQL